MVNIQGEWQGQVKPIQPLGPTSEIHVAPDVVDLLHHLPDVFSPSRKNTPVKRLHRTKQEGKHSTIEAGNGSSACHPRLPWGKKHFHTNVSRALFSGAARPVLQPLCPSPSPSCSPAPMTPETAALRGVPGLRFLKGPACTYSSLRTAWMHLLW